MFCENKQSYPENVYVKVMFMIFMKMIECYDWWSMKNDVYDVNGFSCEI